MKIERFIVGIMQVNGYVVYDENTWETVIIDPGDEAEVFQQYIEQNQLKLKGIILTHCHYDHIGAVEELKEKYNCFVYIHKKDMEGLKNSNINYSMPIAGKTEGVIADRLLQDGDSVRIGELPLEVIHTPGHTAGSICLKVKNQKIIFTGDTVFRDEIGRMDLASGSETDMKKSIIDKISNWPEDTKIYPGHGDTATMEYIKRKNNEYLYMVKNQ